MKRILLLLSCFAATVSVAQSNSGQTLEERAAYATRDISRIIILDTNNTFKKAEAGDEKPNVVFDSLKYRVQQYERSAEIAG